MRRRITRALLTAAAAGATITTLGLAASPAGASAHRPRAFSPSGGTPIATSANCTVTPLPSDKCAMIGYQASGRDFRFAQALITVPNHVGDPQPGVSGDEADPSEYVALDNSGTATYQYARVGIAPCTDGDDYVVPGVTFASLTGFTTCPASGWEVFAAVAGAGSPPTVAAEPLASAFEGDGILVNVYLTPTGNSVHTTITLPDGTTYNNTFAVTGPVYTKALAVADYTTALENDEALLPQPAVPSAKIRDSQFLQGRFTTASGQRGTFSGPWTLNALEATSNGSLPPSGTLIGQPSYLWTDGNSLHGLWGDAFGVWRFPF